MPDEKAFLDADKMIADHLAIRRVANGWVIDPGARNTAEFMHIATTPSDLGEHVKKWAREHLKKWGKAQTDE